MVNFPIVGGTSGHLLGSVLAAVVLGPWGAVLAMTVVLIVQCFLFYDGGVTVLGANLLNMAVIAPLAGYGVYRLGRAAIRGPAGDVAGAVVAAWISVQLAATTCALELWWSGTYTLATVLPAMLIIHSFIGIGEALITGAVVAFLLRVRPDLLYPARAGERSGPRAWQVAAAGLAVALAIAFFLSPLASAAPDGLEQVAQRLGEPNVPDGPPATALLADYEVAGLGGVWLATSLAGAIGALAVFALAWGLTRALRVRLTETR
jgi:cobalt/nickel transport system permease protein